MIIDASLHTQIPALRSLWKEAFGDSDSFLDDFFRTAFHPDRCRIVTENGQIIASLYWFHCVCEGQPIAYLYAIATAKKYRGQGVCHKLMESTHRHLHTLGYHGVILVPGNNELFPFYESMGYQTCSTITTLECTASSDSVALSAISSNEFLKLRRTLLPRGSVLQENEHLDFLQTQARFYAGENFLLVARKEADTLYGIELLGDHRVAPQLPGAFQCTRGVFRTPGTGTPFAMYLPLTKEAVRPSYFGFAFD